ncbi:MAG TPA: MFS transporter [Acidimicrobiales bacterium]|nr:MFS transporter [Acidimicrobiales bacterium]
MSGAQPRPGRPRRGLHRNRDFLKLWAGETTANVGDQVSLLALPLTAILLLRADPLQVGLVSGLETLPFVLVGLPAGVWLERVRRRPVLVATGAGRAGILALVPVLGVLGWLSLPALDAVALAVGSLTTFFDIAWQTYLPSLVGADRVHEANARLSTSSSGARLAGPGLAGVAVGALSAPVALLADALGFLAAACCVAGIRRPEPRPTRAAKSRLVPEVGQGLGYVMGHRLLRWTATATGCFNAVEMALNVVLVLFEARVLHFSPGLIGLVFMLGNIGFILGALAVRPITARLGIGPTIVVAACLMALAPAVFPLAHPAAAVPLLVGGWFLRAVASPVYNTNQVSLRLAITPEPLLARMTATMKFFVMGGMPVGSFLGGALGAALGLRPTLWTIAAVSVVPFLAVALTDVRRVRTAPEHLRPPGGPHASDHPGPALPAA